MGGVIQDKSSLPPAKKCDRNCDLLPPFCDLSWKKLWFAASCPANTVICGCAPGTSVGTESVIWAVIRTPKSQHLAWDLQAQADVAEQEQQHMIAEADEARLRADNECQKEDEWKELEKKHPKINDFDNNKMIGYFIMPRPSQFPVGKLKSFSFIKLWYFTEEGCSKAQETNRTLPEDTYGIMQVDDLVALKPVTAFKALKNAISDADLTWRQMNISKNMILHYMEICDWPQKHMESFH